MDIVGAQSPFRRGMIAAGGPEERQTAMVEHRIAANGLTHLIRDEGPKDAPAAILLHGFPDTGELWAGITPQLTASGFRIIAPDLRGFGRSDMASSVKGYEILTGAVPDVLGVMDALDISSAHLVGHDFGAAVAWALAARYPNRFKSLTAISLGHPRAYLSAGWGQRKKSWYFMLHHMRGLCEALYRFDNWRLFRAVWPDPNGAEAAIAALSQPGRLTAGLNWYRANSKLRYLLFPPPFASSGEEIVRIPTMGVWGVGDPVLRKRQMTGSEAFVEGSWRYEPIEGAGHWVPRDAPDRLAALLASHWGAD